MPLTINNQNINLSSWITHLLIQELNDNNPVTTGIITDFLEHHGNTLPIVNNYINNIYVSPNDTHIDSPNGSPPYDSPPYGSPPYDSPPYDSPPYDSPPNDSPPNGTPPNGSPPNDTPPNGSPYIVIPDLDDQDLYDTDYSSDDDDGYDSPTSITDFPNHVIP